MTRVGTFCRARSRRSLSHQGWLELRVDLLISNKMEHTFARPESRESGAPLETSAQAEFEWTHDDPQGPGVGVLGPNSSHEVIGMQRQN
jgi:hypothetical protein